MLDLKLVSSLSSGSEAGSKPPSANSCYIKNTSLSLFFVAVACVFGMFRMLSEEVGELAYYVVVSSGFGVLLFSGKGYRRTTVIRLFFASVVIILTSWVWMNISHPQWAESSPKFNRLTRWFGFVGLAWWFGGQVRNVATFWMLSLVALLASPWIIGGGWNEVFLAFRGKRIDFGFSNAQHCGLIFGVALIGLVAFAPRCLQSRHLKWSLRIFWFFAVYICLIAVLCSQTRGVWLGILAAGVVYLGCFVFMLRKAQDRNARKKILFSVIYLSFFWFAVVQIQFGEMVSTRLQNESSSIELIATGNPMVVNESSIGVRIQSWKEAANWFIERPILGWSGNGKRLLFEHSETLPEHIKALNLGHLHSSYFDTIVNFGVLGLALMLSLYALLVVRSFDAWKFGFMPGDIFVFSLSFFAFWLVVNLFESYMYFSSGVFAFTVVCSGLRTFQFRFQVGE